MSGFFAILLSLLAIFLILLVLVQRGRGGGLAGALGGMGGSSAFGAKAGDIFTRITIITAAIWIAVCLTALMWAEHRGDAFGSGSQSSPATESTGPVRPGVTPPATSTPVDDKSGKDAATVPASETAPAATTAPATTTLPAESSAPPATSTTPPAETAAPPADATAPTTPPAETTPGESK